MSTDGVPVLLTGRHVADHSTPEELSSGELLAKSITLTLALNTVIYYIHMVIF